MCMPADSIAARLEKRKREVIREWQPRIESVRRAVKRVWRRETVAALFLASLKALALVALPFLVYVRASVFLYRHGAHPWIAILVSAVLTVGIVSGFVILLARRFRGRAGLLQRRESDTSRRALDDRAGRARSRCHRHGARSGELPPYGAAGQPPHDALPPAGRLGARRGSPHAWPGGDTESRRAALLLVDGIQHAAARGHRG